MDVAKEVMQGILDLMAPQDSVGIVLFSDDACAPLQLGPVRCIDMAAVKRQASACAGPTGGLLCMLCCPMGGNSTHSSSPSIIMIRQCWKRLLVPLFHADVPPCAACTAD
jgi:hypothetical protein